MTPIPEWLNYGALGLTTLILLGGFYLGRQVLQRLEDAGKFTEELAKSSVTSMQQIVRDNSQSQRDVASALSKLVLEIEKGQRDLAAGQAAILRRLEK